MFLDDLQAIHFHASLMWIERRSILKSLESKSSFSLTEMRISRVNPKIEISCKVGMNSKNLLLSVLSMFSERFNSFELQRDGDWLNIKILCGA